MFSTAIATATDKIAAASTSPQAAGVFDWVNEKTAATQTAIQGILVVLGLIVALIIAWRGKNVGSVVMGIIVGGLIAALPMLISFFSERAAGETVGMDTANQMITYARAALTTRI
ncbi:MULTISPECIES: hypothetical protein [unclassified Arthrobacter]|uniref:hypothetical protein n=1 Tax=unclassified Arthrobacter TaxID=235627 RepID=UPI000CE435FE|nr:MULTISPECIES: hypothetical protein [unclassified Arthrobacter]